MSLELLRSPSLLSHIIYNKPETALYLSVLTVAYCGIVGHGVPPSKNNNLFYLLLISWLAHVLRLKPWTNSFNLNMSVTITRRQWTAVPNTSQRQSQWDYDMHKLTPTSSKNAKLLINIFHGSSVFATFSTVCCLMTLSTVKIMQHQW
jgi:hypothetical protein